MHTTPVPPQWPDRSVGASIESRNLLISELLCESVDLHAGERVLAAACGSGSAALAAARRFCRAGGRIGMVGWTPDGYVGELFSAIGRRLPCGTRERLRHLFGPEVAITAPRRSFLWRFPSAEQQVEFLANFHAPTVTALRALGPERTGALKAELLEVAGRFDVSEDDTLVLRLDYLEVVVRKPGWL